MERNMRLNEDVVRFLTTRLEAATKNPSPIIDRNNDNFERFNMNNEEAA
jgi:ribosomal protein S6